MEKLLSERAARRSDVAAVSTPTFQNEIGRFIGELGVPNKGLPALLVDAGTIITEADADLVGSAWLVAVTVAVVFDDTFGAVKSPELEIVPSDADHVTPVFVDPLTVSVNCCVASEASVVFEGLIDMDRELEAVDTVIVSDEFAVLFTLSFTVTIAVYEPAEL